MVAICLEPKRLAACLCTVEDGEWVRIEGYLHNVAGCVASPSMVAICLEPKRLAACLCTIGDDE